MVSETEQLYLVLGCFGRSDDGFISCSSCENRILLVHSGLDNYNEIMDYLDNCELFSKAALDFNAIRHILQNMQNKFDQVVSSRHLWSEQKIQLFQKFLLEHKSCGLYLKLLLTQEESKQLEEKQIKIVAKSNIKKTKVKLNKIRGFR